MIDYCKQILGKSIRDLTIEDLKLYFSEVKEETEILEFKSGQGDFEKIFNNNILRTVSAFLNSSGGVLIWGSPEDKAPEKGMPKVCVGDLVPVNEKKEKDQLINRISSAISYMPVGIKIERLDNQDGCVYIIEVQESDSKPHQLNGQYFVRLDGQSKPAPHYFVDSMFNQVKYPDLDGRINFKSVNFYVTDIALNFEVHLFNKSPLMNEKNISFEIVANQGLIMKNFSHEFKSENQNVLHFGRSYLESFELRLVKKQVNVPLKITLAFGGELGPAKINYYLIDINNLTEGRFRFQEHIIEFEENKTFKEHLEAINSNHENNLKVLLNRI